MTVVWRLTTADDGSDGVYMEATVCGGGGQGGCVKSYKRDCFLCRLFISVNSRVLDKIYIQEAQLVLG